MFIFCFIDTCLADFSTPAEASPQTNPVELTVFCLITAIKTFIVMTFYSHHSLVFAVVNNIKLHLRFSILNVFSGKPHYLFKEHVYNIIEMDKFVNEMINF